MPTVIHPTYTNGLLKTDNKLSEFGADPAVQEVAMDNMGLQYTVPIGTILPYAGTVLPAGFLTCNGSSISRTGYASLFSIIGTAFGSASGTTFNVPNITGGLTASSGTIAYIIKYDNISGLTPA